MGTSTRRFVAAVRARVSLRSGTDVEGTTLRIASGAALTPENFWLLGCSAILASIGLDVSSAAVIIGAMLISPLMGPILGVGLGLGTTNRELLQKSLRELAVATAITIAVSATYFLISPLSAPTAELIARTRPTLLDVGVALFGGLAGITAGSRKHQSLALPGVAIATALMPPLCTAGFGLATGNWSFLFGGFYLYALNAIFIALATLLVVRLLRFPRHRYATALARRREKQLVAAVVLLAMLPSVYFLNATVKDVRDNKRIADFVHREVEGPNRVAPQWERRRTEGGDVLAVFVVGQSIPPPLADSLAARLGAYDLRDMRLELVQSGLSAADMQRYQGSVERDVLRAASAATAAREAAATARTRVDSASLASLAQELAIAFPDIEQVMYAPGGDLLAHDSTGAPPALVLTFRSGMPAAARRLTIGRAQDMARKHLAAPAVVVRER